jgi:ABC-2 type transport system ATP-binding protein
MTAREYLNMVGRVFGMTTAALASETGRVLELLDLTTAARRPIRNYSKGMVQRLGLAQTLLHDPDLYILDEPMSGLDPLGRALVKKIMLELKQRGKTVFFSTHVTADVEAVCDRVGIIVAGRLRAFKPVQDVLQGGIEGYEVHVRGGKITSGVGIELIESRQDMHVYHVTNNEMANFMMTIGQKGGEVHFMETRRKDLEAFFLDIVKSGSS